MLSTGSIQEDSSQHYCKIVDWDVKNLIKQNYAMLHPLKRIGDQKKYENMNGGTGHKWVSHRSQGKVR